MEMHLQATNTIHSARRNKESLYQKLHIYIYICVCVCIYMGVYMCMCVYIYMYMYINLSNMCIYVYIYTYIHIFDRLISHTTKSVTDLRKTYIKYMYT